MQKFDSDGTYLDQWGTEGTDEGQFTYPTGIAVDSAGNVYVADRDNHRFQKFDSSGNFMSAWGSNGTGEGEFASPQGIAAVFNGWVYVADSTNHRIQKFFIPDL